MYPAFVAGHSDIMRAADAEVAPSYGDVGATRLWAPAGCSRRIIDRWDLEKDRRGVHSGVYIHIYIHVHTYIVHTYIHTYKHTYVHIFIVHTYIHTLYIHTYCIPGKRTVPAKRWCFYGNQT